MRFAAGGICGSDMHYFRHGRIGNFVVTAPLVLGHEVAGVVEAVGEGVTGVAPGARVAVNPSRWCGHCARCREGRRNLCENIYFMGSASKTPHMQGGFATLFDATPEQCVPVPDAVPLEAAALAEPLAVCLHAVARGEVAGQSVVVIGAGPIGLLTMLAARLKGASETTMVDIAAAPLAFASRLGADRVDRPLRRPRGPGGRSRPGRGDRGLRQPGGARLGDHRGAARRHGRARSAACPAAPSRRRSTR